jgi:hypothetical protein
MHPRARACIKVTLQRRPLTNRVYAQLLACFINGVPSDTYSKSLFWMVDENFGGAYSERSTKVMWS